MTDQQPVRVFLSYARGDDEPFVKRLYEDLTASGLDVWWDRVSMPARQLTFHQEIGEAISAHDRFLFVIGPAAIRSAYVEQEWRWALKMDKPINPIVRLDDVRADGDPRDAYELIPDELKLINTEDFRGDAQYDFHLSNLVRQLTDSPPRLGALFEVPELPPHFLARPDILREIKDAVMVDLQKPVVISGAGARVGIQGMGGIGKSVLAAALVRDRDVRRAYPDGIVWVTVGQRPNVLGLLTELAQALECDDVLQNIGPAKTKLRELLLDKAVLLVLDDVWDTQVTDAFNILGVRCRTVITTRDSGIIKTVGGTLYQVQLLTESEALHLLASSVSVARDALPDDALEIVRECGCLALGVALCAGMAASGIAWASILKRLRNADIARIRDRHSINEQHSSIYRAMQVSVDALTPDEQRRFAELAVFPRRPPTPAAAVNCLWEHTGNLDDLDTEELLVSLSERSLIRLDTERSATDGAMQRRVSLHDLLADYATRLTADHTALHNQLLEAYSKKCADGAWPTGPNDGYFFQCLCHHLLKANRREELETLLTDFDFLQSKVTALGPQPLIEDYDLLDVDRNEPLGLIQGAVVLSANALARDPSELAAQLLGRFLGNQTPAVRRLLDKMHAPGECWLRPIHPCLIPPGGPLIRTIEGHMEVVCSVALHADDRQAVSGDSGGMLKVWDMNTGECLRTFRGHTGHVTSVALLADDRRAVSTGGRALKMWDLATGECLRTFEGHTDLVSFVALHADGRWAVSASWDNTLKVWDLETGDCLRTLEGHTGGVTSVALHADGCRAVSAGGWNDKTLKVWDLETGECIRTLEGHTGDVRAVVLRADGRRAVSAAGDKTLKVWDMDTGECLRTLEGHTGGVNYVALRADCRLAVSASDDKMLKVWDLETGECLRTHEGHTGSVKSVALHADGRRAVSAGGFLDETLKVWDLETDASMRTLEGHAHFVNSVALYANGRLAVSASCDKTLKVWDMETGDCLRTLKGHTDMAWSVALHADGRRAVSASCDKTLKVWDLETGVCLRTFEGHASRVFSVAFHADGRRAVSASWDNTLKVWNLETGDCLRTLEGHASGVRSVALHVDGRLAVSASYDHTLKVWDLESGDCLRTLEGHTSGVYSVALHADGRLAVSASYDHTLKVWDLETGNCLRTLEGHASGVRSVALHADGRRAISASADKTLKVWDLDTGQELASFTADAGMECCAIAPTGDTVVAGDILGHMYFLRLEDGNDKG